MRCIRIADAPPDAAFGERQAQADALARRELGDPMLLSWYDGPTGRESPNGVSECSQAPSDAGARRYAESRGALLAVELGAGATLSVFCYLDLAA
jgi:hypothetical protein